MGAFGRVRSESFSYNQKTAFSSALLHNKAAYLGALRHCFSASEASAYISGKPGRRKLKLLIVDFDGLRIKNDESNDEINYMQ